MNDNSGKKAGSRINGDEMCMICGNSKQPGKLVCYVCFQKWQADRERSLVDDVKDIALLEWTLEKAKESESTLETEMLKAKQSLDGFKEKIQQSAYEDIKAALSKNGTLTRDEFSDIVEKRRQKLWTDGNGNRLFGHYKFLEFRFSRLPEFTEMLEAKITAKSQETQETEQ